MNGEEIFKGEPQEAVEKLKTTLRICGTFKSHYFDYKVSTTPAQRNLVPDRGLQTCPAGSDFHNQSVFLST
jgi:hypothetical protein